MTMLFYSTDATEVQLADRECHSAGIASEIRHSPLMQLEPGEEAAAELWIQDDRDHHRALMLCVQLGVGFSRRPKLEFEMDGQAEEPAFLEAAAA